MATLKGFKVPAPVVPQSTGSKYPTTDTNFIGGGRHIYATKAEIYSKIPKLRRKVGMLAYALDTKIEYILVNNPATDTTTATDWEEYQGNSKKIAIGTDELDLIRVTVGTAASDLTMPTTVKVLFVDGSDTTATVTWNTTTYDPTKLGLQVIIGDIALPAGTLNANSKIAQHIMVIPTTRTIDPTMTIINLAPLSVKYDTPFSIIGLPKNTTVVFDDGSIETVAIDWDSAEPFYNSTSTGSAQTLTGSLVLPEGASNCSPAITPQIKVTVLPNKKNITQIDPNGKLAVVKGKDGDTFSDLTFPSKVEIMLDDGTTTDIDVTWNSSDFNGGYENQIIGGTLNITDPNITNTLGLKPDIRVYLKPKDQIFSIIDPSPITVTYGTPEAAITFPTLVSANTSNGTQTFPVTWTNKSIYNENKSATYTFSGKLNIGTDYEFSGGDEEFASFKVTVGANPVVTYEVVSYTFTKNYNVANGTSAASIGLPANVTLNYKDSNGNTYTQSVPVSWNTASYNSTTAGTYTIPGTTIISSSIDNPSNIEPEAIVIVAPAPPAVTYTISGYDAPAMVNIDYDKTAADLAPLLPTTIVIHETGSDGTTRDETVPVSWNTSSFNGKKSGLQQFSGVYTTLSSDVNNDNNVFPTVSVTVASVVTNPDPSKDTITAIVNPNPISVANGTSNTDLNAALPTTVSCTVNKTDGSQVTEYIPVSWNISNYKSTQGTYVLDGTLQLPSGYDNKITTPPQISVTVDPSVTVISTLQSVEPVNLGNVDYNTKVTDLTLPTTVTIHITKSDGTKEDKSVSVTWNTSSYSPTTSGTQTINGTVSTGSVQNPSNIGAIATVTVGAKPSTGDIEPDSAFTNVTTLSVPQPTTSQTDITDTSLNTLTIDDFYGESDANPAQRKAEVRFMGVLASDGTNATPELLTLFPEGIRVPVSTLDSTDQEVANFKSCLAKVDAAMSVGTISSSFPGGTDGNFDFDDDTHTLTLNGAASNGIIIKIRYKSDGYINYPESYS
jgi:hypothetical protein